MIRKLLLTLLIVSSTQLLAQGIDTDSTHHSIVMRSKSPYKLSYIIGEKKRIKIYDKKGRTAKGRLYFITDSTVQIINTITLKKDTLRIKDINKIRTSSLISQAAGTTGMLTGGGFFFGGIDLIASGAGPGASPNYGPVAIFFGLVCLAASIPVITVSAALLNGKALPVQSYDLKLHTSKGYKLKRKHLKYLYPRT